MLSVQSVNLMSQPAFQKRTKVDESDFAYSRKEYEADKTKLEEHLDDLNDVIENTDVPKPIRAFGKVVSLGIGAGLGFVSMKYGSQGVVKLAKSGGKYLKDLGQKPFVRSVIEKTGKFNSNVADYPKSVYNKMANWALENKHMQKVSKFFKGLKDNKFSKKVVDLGNKFTDLKPVKYINQKAVNAHKGVKSITGQQVENGFVNLMAVSGGVSGGVAALQEVTKE